VYDRRFRSINKVFRFLATLGFVCAAGSAHAAVLTESFDSPNFADWQSGWFGQNSNAKPFLGNPNDRGNNVTGLTIYDGNSDDGRAVGIFFNAAFAATITNFSFDMLNYTSGLDQLLEVFDKDGNTLFGTVLPVVAQDPSADNGATTATISQTANTPATAWTPPMESAASASGHLAPKAMSRSMTSAQPLRPFRSRPRGL
jgi:hypothetical protein